MADKVNILDKFQECASKALTKAKSQFGPQINRRSYDSYGKLGYAS